jgi:hypothetical protein
VSGEDLADATALALAVIFGWAAVAKLITHRSTRESFSELGLVAPRALSFVVPAAELVTAILLVVAAPVGAATAIFLLVSFTVILARALRSGLSVSCSCFGATAGSDVSVIDVVRNAGLAVLCQLALFARTPIQVGLVGVAVVSGVVLIGWWSLRVARRGLAAAEVGRGSTRRRQ